MSTLELFIIAVGLSMDAFAVAICKGLSVKELKFKHMLIVGLYFGAFQGLMPLGGYFLGKQFEQYIVSIDLGKRKKDLSVPFKMWLLANSLNFLLALLISLGVWFSDIKAFSSIGGVATAIKYIIEGMYAGVLSLHVGGAALNSYWFMHFLTTVPSFFAIFASYLCGINNINFGGLFSPNAAQKK